MADRPEKIKPHDMMVDEGGNTMGWLASAYSREDIVYEWDYLVEDPANLLEQHYAVRWTTEKERSDPDTLYDMFGDVSGAIDTTIYYWRVKADWLPKNQYQQGPFLYYEVP